MSVIEQDVNMDCDQASYEWVDSGDNIRKGRVLGHWLLCRKCAKPESDYIVPSNGEKFHTVTLANGMTVDVDAAVQALTHHTSFNICEVLAVGGDCNSPRPRAWYKAKGIPHGDPIIPVKRGDLVVLPECSKYQLLIRPVTCNDYDVMVDELEVLAIVEPDEKDSLTRPCDASAA